MLKTITKANHHLQEKQQLQWQQIKTPSTVISRRSCHSSCIHQDQLYVYGGYDNSSPTVINDFFIYHFQNKKWQQIKQEGQLPGPRHSHSVIVYKDKMYLFGGMYQFMDNTNQLHIFDFNTKVWVLQNTTNTPPAIDSHKACLFGNQMIVGLGYSEHQFNSNIYSLNLDTFTWKTIFDPKQTEKDFPQPRIQATFCLYENKILVYGGKDTYNIFNDLWSFDLSTNQYSLIQLTEFQGRYGHASVIDNNKLYVFGGTRGVTHQRNDLIAIDLLSKTITTCWTDSQEERKRMKEECANPLLKKSRRDSAKKGINWSIFFQQQEEEQQVKKSPGKYRTQLKEASYYNSLYDRPQKESYSKKKQRKNPLLKQLNRSQSSEGDNFNLTATFQILTNSIMQLTGKSNFKEDKSYVQSQFWRKIPKARDNSTAEVRKVGSKVEMIIFGGGMHKIGFNDLIKVDLNQLHQKHLALLQEN